jgi:hypothetical protein
MIPALSGSEMPTKLIALLRPALLLSESSPVAASCIEVGPGLHYLALADPLDSDARYLHSLARSEAEGLRLAIGVVARGGQSDFG